MALFVSGVNTIFSYLNRHGAYTTARTYLEQALAVVVDDGARAELQRNLGETAAKMGDYETAETCIREALTLARAKSRKSLACDLLLLAGNLAINQGQYDVAASTLGEGVALARQLSDAQKESRFLQGLGMVAAKRSAYADAETHYHQAMTLARAAANQEQIADLLRNLGTPVPRQPKNEG